MTTQTTGQDREYGFLDFDRINAVMQKSFEAVEAELGPLPDLRLAEMVKYLPAVSTSGKDRMLPIIKGAF